MHTTWDDPYDGGSEITGYQIQFKAADGSYHTVLAGCDGISNSQILTDKACRITSLILTQAPFSLQWGDHVFANIVALNVKGSSETSDDGNGAQVLTIPDAPINLAEVVALTNAETCGMTWQNGPNNGGTPVIDYRVSFNQGFGSTFYTLESNVLTTPYEATPLVAGTTYTFKV